jgi:hypothetical protein
MALSSKVDNHLRMQIVYNMSDVFADCDVAMYEAVGYPYIPFPARVGQKVVAPDSVVHVT